MIVDANVLLSALLGRSLPRLQRARLAGLPLGTPAHQLREVRLILRHRLGWPETDVLEELYKLGETVGGIDRTRYDAMEVRARVRLSPSGQSDWPVLAAAMALDRPILSNDRDFFGVGVPVWTPHVLDRELETLDA